jgi:hypothetical protein
MKKILVSMMTRALVSALIGGGVYATFSDPETSGSSSVGAGTLDLTLDGGSDIGAALFTVSTWEPGVSGNDYATLKNVGSLGAKIEFEMSTVDSLESTGTTGVADAGGTTTTMVDSALTEADDYWIGYDLVFTSGSNAGESQTVTDFVAATDTITVGTAFSNAPSAGDTYMLTTEYEWDTTSDQAVTATGAGSTTTIVDSALGGSDDQWNGYSIEFTSGTNNDGQVRTVTDYVAASGTITFSPAITDATAATDTASLKVGELSSGMNIAIWIDAGTLDGTYDGGTEDYLLTTSGTITQPGALTYSSVADYSGDDWGTNSVALAAAGEVRVYVAWDGTGSAGNTAQGDTFAFTMTFDLLQD